MNGHESNIDKNDLEILARDNKLVYISDRFEKTFDFDKKYIGKDILDIWYNILKITIDFEELCKVNTQNEGYIFDKQLKAMKVKTEAHYNYELNEIRVCFNIIKDYILEDAYSLLEDTNSILGVGTGISSTKDGVLLKCNDILLKILDMDRHNFIGRKYNEIFLDWSGSNAKDICEEVIRSGKPYYCPEYQSSLKKYRDSVWEYTLKPVVLEGSVQYIIYIIKDVTEHFMRKEEVHTKSKMLENQNRTLNVVQENISDCLIGIDVTGKYIIKNRAAKENIYLKDVYKVEDWVKGENALYDMNNKELSLCELPSSKLIRGEIVNNEKYICKRDGYEGYINICGSPIFDQNGNFIMAVMCSSDITEMLKAKIAIENKNKELNDIIENISEAILIFDKKGSCYFKNKVAREYYKAKDINDIKLYTIDGKKISQKDMPFLKVIDGKKIKELKLKMVYKGRTRFISFNGTPIYDNNGSQYLSIISTRDISEVIKHEEIINAQKTIVDKNSKMKDEFLYTITHEFKTPITVISSATQALEVICGEELSPKAKLFLKKIKQNTYRMIRLINNLLDITKLENGYLKLIEKEIDIVNVTRLITESVVQYAEGKGLKISFEAAMDKKVFLIDEEKYERILLNLLSNSIKFTPSGKNIKVKVDFDGTNVHIAIADEGVGIPIDKQSVIFNRFIQIENSLSKQSEGSGIGLSLVKLLTEAMGGTISIQSEVAKGSTFTVSFPQKTTSLDRCSVEEITYATNIIERLAIEFSDIYS